MHGLPPYQGATKKQALNVGGRKALYGYAVVWGQAPSWPEGDNGQNRIIRLLHAPLLAIARMGANGRTTPAINGTPTQKCEQTKRLSR